jgi:hypothetical protein
VTRVAETPRIVVRRLTHREGFAILVIPPNGEQPDRFEFWVDEHYIPAAQRPTRRKTLLAEVLKMARILRSTYKAT